MTKSTKIAGAIIGGIALLAVAFMLALGSGRGALPRDFHREDYVITTVPTWGPPTNASLKDKLVIALFQFRQRYQRPKPATFSFPPFVGRCSIHGLLNQCMQVTGVRYVIEKNVAAGSVHVGQTNTLNGSQWVAAFEDALQNSPAEWWEPDAKQMRRENLVLVKFNAKTTLVLPKDKAAAFQSANPPVER